MPERTHGRALAARHDSARVERLKPIIALLVFAALLLSVIPVEERVPESHDVHRRLVDTHRRLVDTHGRMVDTHGRTVDARERRVEMHRRTVDIHQ